VGIFFHIFLADISIDIVIWANNGIIKVGIIYAFKLREESFQKELSQGENNHK